MSGPRWLEQAAGSVTHLYSTSAQAHTSCTCSTHKKPQTTTRLHPLYCCVCTLLAAMNRTHISFLFLLLAFTQAFAARVEAAQPGRRLLQDEREMACWTTYRTQMRAMQAEYEKGPCAKIDCSCAECLKRAGSDRFACIRQANECMESQPSKAMTKQAQSAVWTALEDCLAGKTKPVQLPATQTTGTTPFQRFGPG